MKPIKELPTWKDLFPFRVRWKNRVRIKAMRNWLTMAANTHDPARGIEFKTGPNSSMTLPTIDEVKIHRARTPQYASIRLRQQAQRLEDAFGVSEDSIELLEAAKLLEIYYDPARHVAEQYGYRND